MKKNKIDGRVRYILVLDTETCNGDPNSGSNMVYDIGGVITDRRGKIYEKFNFLIKEVFNGMEFSMNTCYYKEKLPQYYEQIMNGELKSLPIRDIRLYIRRLMDKYCCQTVAAYNARFDVNALNSTIRYITKSADRFFLPYGCEVWDIMYMVRSTLAKRKTYISMCEKYGWVTKHKKPRPRITAEVAKRYISQNDNFEEAHTALEDVYIETEIMSRCFQTHRKMTKILYAAPTTEWYEMQYCDYAAWGLTNIKRK